MSKKKKKIIKPIKNKLKVGDRVFVHVDGIGSEFRTKNNTGTIVSTGKTGKTSVAVHMDNGYFSDRTIDEVKLIEEEIKDTNQYKTVYILFDTYDTIDGDEIVGIFDDKKLANKEKENYIKIVNNENYEQGLIDAHKNSIFIIDYKLNVLNRQAVDNVNTSCAGKVVEIEGKKYKLIEV